jgi:hypothetical protein
MVADHHRTDLLTRNGSRSFGSTHLRGMRHGRLSVRPPNPTPHPDARGATVACLGQMARADGRER